MAFYNDKKHSTIKFAPGKITEIDHDKEMLAKFKEYTIKSRKAQIKVELNMNQD